jgi:hypothetical protein
MLFEKIRFNHQSLLFKSFVIVLLTTVATLVAVGFFSFSFTVSALQNSIVKNERQVVEIIMNKIDRLMYERFNDIQTIAGEVSITNHLLNWTQDETELPDKSARNAANLKRLKDLSILTGPWNTLFVVDTKGTIVLSTTDEESGQAVDQWHYKDLAYKEAIQGKVNYSDFVILKRTEEPTIVFAAPIRDKNNPLKPIIGAVVGDLSWPVVAQIFDEIVDSRVYLLNHTGAVIASNTDAKSVFADPVHGQSIIEEFHKQKASTVAIHRSHGILNKDIMVLTDQKGHLSYKGNDWHLVLQLPESIVMAPYREAVKIVLLLLPVILLFSGIILICIKKFFVQPLAAFSQTVESMSRGDLSKRLPSNPMMRSAGWGLSLIR